MFEIIFFPQMAAKYRAAPLADHRERYLVYLKDTGATRSSLRKCANNQLSLMRLLSLKEGVKMRVSQIQAAAAIWSQPKGRRCPWRASPKSKARFVNQAIQWLRFLGWLDEPQQKQHPHHANIAIYKTWLREERCLSTATIQNYCHAADRFFFWLIGKGSSLSAVRITDIDDAIAAEQKRGTWNRRMLHSYAQRLRAFFRFAEARKWCMPGLAAGIMPPRFRPEEGIPKGLDRDVVLRLLSGTEGNSPADKRDRAILMLFAIYGLRASEVSGLQLDDIDWHNEIIRVRCPKPVRTHTYPLSPAVGEAILRYIKEVRPSGFGRTLFFKLHAPIRLLERRTLGKMVRARLTRLGITSGKRGTHALRHGAAQHLINQGMSMKVIADFLGHRNLSSTAIYAKVNIDALREVGNFHLEGLS